MKHEARTFSTGTCFFVFTWKTHCNASRRHCNEMHIHFPIMTSPIKLHCHCKLPWALRRSNFSWILLNYSRCYSSPWTHTRPPTVTVLEMSTPFFILGEFHEQILDNYSSGRKFVSIFRSFAYFRFVLERPLQISVDSFASPCFFFFPSISPFSIVLDATVLRANNYFAAARNECRKKNTLFNEMMHRIAVAGIAWGLCVVLQLVKLFIWFRPHFFVSFIY